MTAHVIVEARSPIADARGMAGIDVDTLEACADPDPHPDTRWPR